MLPCRSWFHKCSVVSCRLGRSRCIRYSLVIRPGDPGSMWLWIVQMERQGMGSWSVQAPHWYTTRLSKCHLWSLFSSWSCQDIFPYYDADFPQPVLHTYTTLSMKLTRSEPHLLILAKRRRQHYSIVSDSSFDDPLVTILPANSFQMLHLVYELLAFSCWHPPKWVSRESILYMVGFGHHALVFVWISHNAFAEPCDCLTWK